MRMETPVTGVLLLCVLLQSSRIAAQEGPIAPSAPHDSAPQSTSARSLPGATTTYTNATLGITFDIPDQYSISQGPAAWLRMGDFSRAAADPGEFVFARLDPSNVIQVPGAGPSVSAMYFGVHLGISKDSCVPSTGYPRYTGGGGTAQIGGVNFEWRQVAFRGGTFLARGPSTYRDYYGFTNSVCYEFHIRVSPSARVDLTPDFEAVLSTVKFIARTPVPRAASDLPETPFPVPADVVGLIRLTDWKISYPKFRMLGLRWPPEKAQVCGMLETAESNRILFEHVSDPSDLAAADAETRKLEATVLHYLDQNGWSPVSNPNQTPGLDGCYRKGDSVMEVQKGPIGCSLHPIRLDFHPCHSREQALAPPLWVRPLSPT